MTDLLNFGCWPKLELKSIKPNDVTTKLKQSVFTDGRRLTPVGRAFRLSVVFRIFTPFKPASKVHTNYQISVFAELTSNNKTFQGIDSSKGRNFRELANSEAYSRRGLRRLPARTLNTRAANGGRTLQRLLPFKVTRRSRD
jgi:hypothetical protein